MWSYYNTQAYLESRSRIWIRYTCTVVILFVFGSKFDTIFFSFQLLCCFEMKMRFFFFFFSISQWNGNRMAIQSSNGYGDNEAAMATCRGAMIALSSTQNMWLAIGTTSIDHYRVNLSNYFCYMKETSLESGSIDFARFSESTHDQQSSSGGSHSRVESIQVTSKPEGKTCFPLVYKSLILGDFLC